MRKVALKPEIIKPSRKLWLAAEWCSHSVFLSYKWALSPLSSPTACGRFSTCPQRYAPRMGSRGRRQSETRMVLVLDCQHCGELTPASRFRYVCEHLMCDHCGAENSQMRV